MSEASGAPERCQGVSRYMPQVVPCEQAPLGDAIATVKHLLQPCPSQI